MQMFLFIYLLTCFHKYNSLAGERTQHINVITVEADNLIWSHGINVKLGEK